MRDIKYLGGKKELGGIEGEETIIRTHYIRKIFIFNNYTIIKDSVPFAALKAYFNFGHNYSNYLLAFLSPKHFPKS